jgi:hypothetical protein
MSALLFRLALVLTVLVARPAGAFLIQEPSMDYFNYRHAINPGTRPAASTWGAVGDADLEDRAAQFLVRFNTSSVVTPGLGVANYQITSLTLTLTVNLEDSYVYDPTFDTLGTYLNPASDLDAGRPIELFAVGYRNGFSTTNFTESSAYSTGGVRNTYAAGFNGGGLLFDVSNNVLNNTEVSPLAIGQIDGVLAGEVVPLEARVTFTITPTDPAVIAWLQASLNAGYLEFMASSLQPSEQMATSGFASFYTKEDTNHILFPEDHLAPQLSGIVAVPEPAAVALLALGGFILLARRKFHE